MNQELLLDFTKPPLLNALAAIQSGGYATSHPHLTAEEKALIYYYTATGSTQINRALHDGLGEQANELIEPLVKAVQKMPIYTGNAYSAAHLSQSELDRLRMAAETGDTLLTAGLIQWPAFLSATRSPRIAKRHLHYTAAPTPHNCLFLINSRQGRAIELLSYYGPNGRDPFDGEQEILFLPNTMFQVVGMDFTSALPQIELIER